MARLVAMAKRNPGKTASVAAALVSIFIGIPSVVATAHYLSDSFEPQMLANHQWVREWGKPIVLTQSSQSLAIDRFLLFQQQQALSNAMKDPGAGKSPIVEQQIKSLNEQVSQTSSRIKDAEKRGIK